MSALDRRMEVSPAEEQRLHEERIAEFQRRVILRGNTRGAADVISQPGEVISRVSRFAGSWEFGDYLLQGVAATSRRFDGLGVVAVIVRDCPRRVPYQGGWTLSYIVLSYVPRIVWADKPAMTIGQWVTVNFGSGRRSSSVGSYSSSRLSVSVKSRIGEMSRNASARPCSVNQSKDFRWMSMRSGRGRTSGRFPNE